MSKIKLNSTISIDIPKLVESRLLVQANSGGGKSWLIRRLIEQAFGKVQIIVLDPEGEYANLRQKFDFAYAGKGGDTSADPRSAALLAKRLLELKASAIVDLYELNPQDRKRFVRLFCDAMVNAPKELWHDCLLIIDEAHVFAPEKGESEAMGPVIDLATRGRKRGYCVVLATQRFSKLNKDAAAECNNKLIGRASQDIDMKRAADELGFNSREQMLSLRLLKPGEFYVFGPAISDEVTQTKIGDVEVKPPPRSAAKNAPPPPPEKIKSILSQLADLPQEAQKETETLQSLTMENRRLKGQISAHKCPVGPDPEKIRAEAEKLLVKAKSDIEKSFDDELRRLKKKTGGIKGVLTKLSDTVSGLLKFMDELEGEHPTLAIPMPTISLPKSMLDPTKPRIHHQDTNIAMPSMSVSGEVSAPEQKVLNAIAWFESIGLMQPKKISVAFLAGYSGSSGGYNNLCGMLRSKGYIAYPSAGVMALTDSGHAVAEAPDKPLSQEELHQKVLEVLPAPEGRVLRPLLSAYPQDLSVQELAEASGYQASSGGFNNLKGRLRSLSLADYPGAGRIKAADLLFIQF